MKLAEFDALCEREWEKNHGDILSLHLTDESRKEFENELLVHPRFDPFFLQISKEEMEAFQDGIAIPRVLNPVTRSTIEIIGGSDRDYAEVRYVTVIKAEA
jgi:hypothetical protein